MNPLNQSEVNAFLADLPEVKRWPELAALLRQINEAEGAPDWELPLLACEAVGGQPERLLPAASAIACTQLSIILVDDMLDQDVHGAYHKYGPAQVANMALALQSIAFRLVANVETSPDRRSAAVDCLARVGMVTALGQSWDVQNLRDEQSYWEVVTAKSAPFYGGALQLGAILGGANSELAEDFHKLGVIVGELVQIEDDLVDAFAVPANADWLQGRNNLLILYARMADHPDRSYFLEILDSVQVPHWLDEAQRILVKSGALSYAIYEMLSRVQTAKELVDAMNLLAPNRIENLFEGYAKSIRSLLDHRGVIGEGDFHRGNEIDYRL